MARSLIDVLERAKQRDRSIRFVDSGGDDVLPLHQLWHEASGLLGALQQAGLSAGDQLVIFTKSNRQFVTCFWAAVLGGIVPVPVAVGISDEHRHKLLRILGQLESGYLVTDADLQSRLVAFAESAGQSDQLPDLVTRTLRYEDLSFDQPGERKPASGNALAFIQYSSGSTGDPKGVCLTHDNVCINIDAIVAATGWDESDVSLSWMPLTHDMGLIGYHLSVMSAGAEHAVMDTNQFVRRPLQWMEKAHELRATQLCSPNFGYKHFLKLFERKGLPDGTDLSSVRLILNGAEPISARLCDQFLEALAPLGLKPEAMFPVYGLAEATVGVTVGTPGKRYETVIVDRHTVAVGSMWSPAQPNSDDALTFVKVGRPINDVELRIVHDDDRPLEDGHVGHIQIRGGNVTAGIYGDSATTQTLLTDDGWLRTGDCGAMMGGELVVTGRQKDLIIVNGQNYLPHDLEEILSALPGLDLNKVVVSSAPIAGTEDGERLLVFVLHRGDEGLPPELHDAVVRRLGEQVGLQVDHVLPVPRIPKTTSGKVQRAALVRQFVAGAFDDFIVEAAGAEIPNDDDALVVELLKICAEHAKEVRIGADDNLFEVGVSSLTLSEIVLGIDERYPGLIDISDIFDVPSVREIAGFLRDKGVDS